MRDWLAEGVDPDEPNELTDDQLDALYQEQLYWTSVHNAWVKAGASCPVCDTILTLGEFEQNYCPNCSVEEIPF